MIHLPRWLFLGLATLSTPLLAQAAGEKENPAKTHVLFMGADVAVERDKRFHRVEDVTGSELKIRIGKKEFFVPTRNRKTDLKINRGLKLSGVTVTLDDLQSGPGYTPANDPRRKFEAASGAAGGAAAVRDMEYGKMITAELVLAAAGNVLSNTPEGHQGRPQAQLIFDAATAAYTASMAGIDSANDSLSSAQFNTGAYADRMQGELAEGNYDTMEVSFKISSPVELDDPHMIVLFRFQEREAKPGAEGLLIHAKAIEPIGPRPKYIRIREAGLPRGFKYIDCSVHIYNRGEEVATNVSPKRVEITREEAKQYLVIDHIGANKGATVPAVPVAGSLSHFSRQGLSIDQLNRICYAKVAADGSLVGVYLDESCHQELEDAAVREALRQVFFKPALDKGQPVEGVARLTLGAI
jgi:hypothetical protein